MSAPAAAQAQAQAIDSPRWSYEFRAGSFEPDLQRFDVFYGDDSETIYAIAGSYRLRDWLEVGGEYAYMRAKGLGILTSTQELGSSVRYQLNPAHIFANYIYQREATQRVIPYVGLAIVVARYEQDIASQSDIEGRTDTGYSARLGVRFLLSSRRRSANSSGSRYQRSFVFLEGQEMSMENDSIELGGTSWNLGFRMEFDF